MTGSGPRGPGGVFGVRADGVPAASGVGGVTGSGPVGRGFTPPPVAGVVAVAGALAGGLVLAPVVVPVGESVAAPVAGGLPDGVSTQDTVVTMDRTATKPAW